MGGRTLTASTPGEPLGIDLGGPVDEVAPALLGAVISHAGVSIRLTEVEAYAGPADPASHAFRGPTARTAVMFGAPGRLYVYFVYGMHWCANLVTGPDGTASAVLMRAGEVVSGLSVARQRRPRSPDRDLARGPARLATTLGLRGEHTGELAHLRGGDPPASISVGPRVGVAAAADVHWRFWVTDDPTVSPYRRAVARRRSPRTR